MWKRVWIRKRANTRCSLRERGEKKKTHRKHCLFLGRLFRNCYNSCPRRHSAILFFVNANYNLTANIKLMLRRGGMMITITKWLRLFFTCWIIIVRAFHARIRVLSHRSPHWWALSLRLLLPSHLSKPRRVTVRSAGEKVVCGGGSPRTVRAKSSRVIRRRAESSGNALVYVTTALAMRALCERRLVSLVFNNLNKHYTRIKQYEIIPMFTITYSMS